MHHPALISAAEKRAGTEKGNGLLNQVCIIEFAISPDND